VLNWHLAHWGFVLNDNKGPTKNCLEMGFRVTPRAAFLARNARAQLLPDKTGPLGSRSRSRNRRGLATASVRRGSLV
jgi:hypothetical protein